MSERAVGMAEVNVASKEMDIHAVSGWTPTGIMVRPGHRLLITARGRWTADPGTGVYGPEGWADHPVRGSRIKHKYAFVDGIQGALVGSLGRDVPNREDRTRYDYKAERFQVGARGVVDVMVHKELFLSINDDLSARGLGDNRGRVRVKIVVRGPAAGYPNAAAATGAAGRTPKRAARSPAKKA